MCTCVCVYAHENIGCLTFHLYGTLEGITNDMRYTMLGCTNIYVYTCMYVYEEDEETRQRKIKSFFKTWDFHLKNILFLKQFFVHMRNVSMVYVCVCVYTHKKKKKKIRQILIHFHSCLYIVLIFVFEEFTCVSIVPTFSFFSCYCLKVDDVLCVCASHFKFYNQNNVIE